MDYFRIASNPEVLKVVRERLAEEQPSDSNAKLQVNIITLQSQISSLTSQHTALQLANSQLVAEKEEVSCIFYYTLLAYCYLSIYLILFFRR